MSETLLTDAISKGKFSVLEVAHGRGYPQDIVTVYTDHDAAFKIHRLEKQIAKETDGEKVNVLDEQRNALVERVKSSALTFHMRGIGEGLIDDLKKKANEQFGADEENVDRNKWLNHSYLANHVVSVTDAENNVDDHRWTSEEIATLKRDLPVESFEKLVELMFELTFAARYFDEVVSADF